MCIRDRVSTQSTGNSGPPSMSLEPAGAPYLTGCIVGIVVVCLSLVWYLSKHRIVARPLLGVRVVCCSDTHGNHRDLLIPPGDVFIHAGDFTSFGKREHAEDFNTWLGELPHKHKLVVNGNHEHNAEWKTDAQNILSNAVFLRGEKHTVQVGDQQVTVFGTDFFWPMKTPNPYYDLIPEDVDLLVCHGPVRGYVDGGTGCQTMLQHVERVSPRLVVSGHIHDAHGVATGVGRVGGTVFVNAANARSGQQMGWDPVTVNI
eukprot:TRINITY_DN1834_c0_g1_i2.p1 TRINITY_DN1834_c0_g1~~TRINITY_DN1834_c0_g1_i2.p1  ORF type:complete len:259 (-),score=51.71 TRINITY_DN1834_c0_g1_i2:120-896(-)